MPNHLHALIAFFNTSPDAESPSGHSAETKRKELYANHVGTEIPIVMCVGPDKCY